MWPTQSLKSWHGSQFLLPNMVATRKAIVFQSKGLYCLLMNVSAKLRLKLIAFFQSVNPAHEFEIDLVKN